MRTTDELKTIAIDILDGLDKKPNELLELAKLLADRDEFKLAQQLLGKAYEKSVKDDDPATHIEIIQKRALYTYKDSEMRKDDRLEEARKILAKDEVLSETVDQETLGIAGAIYKYMWEVDNQRSNLEQAFQYYNKGFQQGPEKDLGYTGINAAFLLDVRADEDEKPARAVGGKSDSAELKRKEAEQIRREIIEKVEPLQSSYKPKKKEDWWWFYATIAEAYFGLNDYEKTVEWLVNKPKEKGITVAGWQHESTAGQLSKLARLQCGSSMTESDFKKSPAGTVLMNLWENPDAMINAFSGKLGLALSGGGYRAALFHVGVMARLAELNLLRRVEVLSCVSGGSILGAHYYLALRNLLQSYPDNKIKQEDYIQIVKDIVEDFTIGIQSNIRTKILAELTTNFKRVFLPGYSRTLRVGELYEKEIFSRIEKDEAKRKALSRQKLWMDELRIYPRTEDGQQNTSFKPASHNWKRQYKVPVLVLNASTLNTGHSWHFTAAYMGEPPAVRDSNIESNYRFYPIDYGNLQEKHPKVRLGHAVAASSCVPGLFEPLAFDDLYEKKSLLLADGGVCDNQGTQALIENDCNVMLVSDGSGQMGEIDVPSSGLLGVLLRSVGISQSRVREAEYYDLSKQKRSTLLREFLFLHLKQDLKAATIAWKDRPPVLKADPVKEDRSTAYGIDRDVQRLLSGIRTDLDSFCEAEAYALMTSAYRMTEHALKESVFFTGLAGAEKRVSWKFLEIEASMKPRGAKKEKLKELLKASSSRGFKVWKISKPLKYTGLALIFLLLAGSLFACFYWPAAKVVPRWLSEGLTTKILGWTLISILGAAIVMFVLGKIHEPTRIRLKRWGQSALYVLTSILMLLGGWLIARIHLWVFDCLYLKHGKLEKFKD